MYDQYFGLNIAANEFKYEVKTRRIPPPSPPRLIVSPKTASLINHSDEFRRFKTDFFGLKFVKKVWAMLFQGYTKRRVGHAGRGLRNLCHSIFSSDFRESDLNHRLPWLLLLLRLWNFSSQELKKCKETIFMETKFMMAVYFYQ